MRRLIIKRGQTLETVAEAAERFAPKVEEELSDGPKIRQTHPYRNGGDGFVLWVEENCKLPIYPEGSDIPVWYWANELPREYKTIWDNQKLVMKEALRMKNGRFVYNLIILCWMRGEGKSLLACLIELWKFMCWPRQQIVLGANSKEQTKFVHYDIIRDIILNSPPLLAAIGKKNVQEKEIRLKDNKGNVISVIKAISSFSGIVSNITGFTFSEIFDMKNPKFFTQLYGSIRNIPNALGVIDSTVSAKTHILYQLYESWRDKKVQRVFFSHRYSREAKSEDFWNPHMSQVQLDDYRATFLPADFDRYFKNIWSAGGQQPFTPEMIEAMHCLGLDGHPALQKDILEVVSVIKQLEVNMEELIEGNLDPELLYHANTRLGDLRSRLVSVDTLYTFTRRPHSEIVMASVSDLERAGDYFDTNWAILGGGDRADPMKIQLGARTILSFVAKGLPGSRQLGFTPQEGVPIPYIYLLIGLWSLSHHTLDEIKGIVRECREEYDGIDALCVERWGMWDLETWAEEEEIANFEAVYPSYDKQKAAFSELYIIVRDGRFKTPTIPIIGSKMKPIVDEEMGVFDHDPDKKWFGSPEKRERHGIQDDSVYSVAWTIYGGRGLTLDTFRPRRPIPNFGAFFQNRGLAGRY